MPTNIVALMFILIMLLYAWDFDDDWISMCRVIVPLPSNRGVFDT